MAHNRHKYVGRKSVSVLRQKRRGDSEIGEGEPVLRNPSFPRKVAIEHARRGREQCLAARNLEWIGCARTAYNSFRYPFSNDKGGGRGEMIGRPKKPAIYIGACRNILGVNVLFRRFIRQILHDRVGLPQMEPSIDQDGNPPIRIQAQIFRRLVFTT